MCRLTADALSNVSSRTADGAATLVVATFDAWAQRGVCGVWCDRAVQHYDQWLVIYAKSWIDEVARSCAAAPPPFPVDRLLIDLRHRLDAQVHLWKAAARRARAEQPSTTSSQPALGSDSGGLPLPESFLGNNPLPQNDPDHHEWPETTRLLADVVARLDSAFVSPSPRTADAATVVDWLVRWAAACFDANARIRMTALVKDKGDDGREAFKSVLETLSMQTLRAVDTVRSRLTGHAKTLMAAFPGVTTSNADCVNFAADVNTQLIPAATKRLSRRRVYWLLHADVMVRQHVLEGASREAASLTSTRAGEPAPEVAAPSTVPVVSSRDANWPVSEADTLAGGSNAHTYARAPIRSPAQDPTSPAQDPASARKWEDVEIRFLSDFTFQAVVNGTVQAPQNYAEVGFGDARHGRPKAAWETLRALAESGGVIAATRTAPEWPRLEKRIQEVRRLLRVYFRLPGDPVPYIDGGYRTRFTIRLSPSYER